jgi:single-stranded-DNA-specific exonuclease
VESISSTQWQPYPLRSKAERQVDAQQGVDSLYAQLLTNRGISAREEISRFVQASYNDSLDPFPLVDMRVAVQRIQQALEKQEHITVYGDYDADGVTSSALLFRALRSLKSTEAVLDFHIPHRQRDGCGLNIAALDMLKQRGTQLIITTDCASSDVEQVHYANELGIDVIITDHHNPPAELPDAYAMVNPWRTDAEEEDVLPYRPLCGAGMAFKLVQALYRESHRSKEDEMELLDLVAIGTIADIVPLIGENHILVRLGMQRLNMTRNPGLQALIRSANLQPGRIRERDIAYGLGPRINAAGRMQDASIAFHLLTTESEEAAAGYVAQLEELNIARQQQTEELMRKVREEAQQHPDDTVILVSGEDWHEGILGLVAGKLVEEIHKPVFVVSNDAETRLSRGSARSQKNFNVIEALRGFPGHLERYGGHAQAAGFTIETTRINDFRQHLLEWQATGNSAVVEEDLAEVIEPVSTAVVEEVVQQAATVVEPTATAHMIDLVLTRTDLLNYNGYTKLRKLSPFGAANPEPIFKIERAYLIDRWASGMNRQNLRLKLAITDLKTGKAITITGTLTRGAELLETFDRGSLVDIIFRIESSEDESRRDIWLKILDVQKSNV